MTKLTVEQVKELIYEHITQENEMGIPVNDTWEGIMEGVDWVDECIESGYSIQLLTNDLYNEVIEKWLQENEENPDNFNNI